MALPMPLCLCRHVSHNYLFHIHSLCCISRFLSTKHQKIAIIQYPNKYKCGKIHYTHTILQTSLFVSFVIILIKRTCICMYTLDLLYCKSNAFHMLTFVAQALCRGFIFVTIVRIYKQGLPCYALVRRVFVGYVIHDLHLFFKSKSPHANTL